MVTTHHLQQNLIPVHEFDLLREVPTRIALTSEKAGWNGLLVRRFDHQHHGSLSVPPIAEDIINIHLGGQTDLHAQMGHRFHLPCTRAGDLCVIPRGMPTEWQWTTPVQVLQICPFPSLLNGVALETLDIDPSQVELTDQIYISDPLVYQIGLALLGELETEGMCGRLYVESLSHTLAMHLLRRYAVFSHTGSGSRNGLSTATLQRVLDYLHENVTGNVALTDIAAVSHLSPFHFTRLFKQSMGRSLHQYVIEQRVEAAKDLLTAGQHSIAEITKLVGFHDQSHLNRHFTRMVGVTPRQYRQATQERTKKPQEHPSNSA